MEPSIYNLLRMKYIKLPNSIVFVHNIIQIHSSGTWKLVLPCCLGLPTPSQVQGYFRRAPTRHGSSKILLRKGVAEWPLFCQRDSSTQILKLKLNFYNTFKIDTNRTELLDAINTLPHRSVLNKFCLGNHWLRIKADR